MPRTTTSNQHGGGGRSRRRRRTPEQIRRDLPLLLALSRLTPNTRRELIRRSKEVWETIFNFFSFLSEGSAKLLITL